MKKTIGLFVRTLAALMAVCMLVGGLVACSGESEIPDGYQYATCNGEYFRLFIPTQWTVNTESGVSGGFYSHNDEATVTMTEIAFVPAEDVEEGKELEAFYADHVAEVSKLKKYELDRELNATLSGYRAKEVYYTASVADKDCKIRQVLSRVAGKYYLFTYSAKVDVFDRWLDIVDGILENITFESFPYEGEHDRKVPHDVTPPEGMKLVSDNEVAYRFFAPKDWIFEPKVGQNLVYASETDKSNVSVIAYALTDDTMTVEDYWKLCYDEYASALENFTLVGVGEGLVPSETTDTTAETSVETTAEITDTTVEEGLAPPEASDTTPAQGVESTMGGKYARVYEYTYTLGGVEYHVRQVIAKYSAMMYIMTYTALPENYETHLTDAVAMQEALTFRKNQFD